MSTRSDIIVQRADGKWARIYCHNDGYLNGVGKTLFESYTDQRKVEKLVALGDLSSLGAEIGRKIGFDLHQKLYAALDKKRITKAEFDAAIAKMYQQCRAYGRDRGEKDAVATVRDTLAQVWPEQDTWTKFIYVWRRGINGDGKWYVGDPDQGTQTLVNLGDALLGFHQQYF